MSVAENTAVFLSYASQDAAAAQRICEALRAAGVEVWFDQNELVGGDAWDAKIRKQIGSCALFVPIISANTEARAEGYFRLEWRLADKRTELMGKTKTFLLPVCIDDTRDANADVPDSFLTVQWTRLRDGAATPAFCERVRRLLNPEAGAKGNEVKSAGSAAAPAAPASSGQEWRLPAAAVLAIILVGVSLYYTLRRGPEPKIDPRVASSPPPAQQETGPRAEARKLIAQVWDQLNRPGVYRAELEIADDLCKRAAELDSANPDVWAAWSQVDSWFVYHNLDSSSARRESARTKAERALRLDARSYEARLAQACYVVRGTLSYRAEDKLGIVPATEQTLRTLVEERGADPRPLFALGILQRNTLRFTEAAATFDLMAKLPGRAADALKEKAWVFIYAAEMREAQEATERSIAAGEFFGNLQLRSYIAVNWTGDLAAARDAVSRVPSSMQSEPMFLFQNIKLFYFCREPQAMLHLLNAVPQSWLSSTAYSGPRHYLIGVAHTMAGKSEAAQLAWQEALRVVEAKLATDAGSGDLQAWKACLLSLVGRRTEAESSARLAESLSRGLFLEALIALGRNDQALLFLESRESRAGFQAWWAWLKNNPLLDPLRSEPRFQALLARAEADPRRSPHVPLQAEGLTAVSSGAGSTKGDKPAPAEKSIAVLAFDNRSDDKAAEFFSDGISEDLINALGRVPGLTVRGRTSAFHFKGRNATAREIGEQLGVTYLVRGSVRQALGKVRITAQLSRAATDEVVWTSPPMERELKDVFAVQDEIVGLIAQNLSVSLGVAARAPHQVNPEALTALMEGRHYWVLRTTEGFARARELFNRAVTLDPHWAPARAALANLLTIEASFLKGGGGSFTELIAAGGREARKAIELDATLAEPHAALGKIAMEEGRLAEAEHEFRRALELEPNNALVRDWYGDLAVTQGRLDVAIAEYRRALELEPLSPYIQWDLAWELMHVRRYAEALTLVERAAALTPHGSARLALRRARLLLELGRPAEAEARAAVQDYLEGRRTGSDPQFANEAVYCLRALTSPAERERWTTELLRLFPDSFASGVILVLQGSEEKAYPLLEKTPAIFWQQLYWDPVFDSLRDTPRFQQLLEKLGCAAEYKVARATQARLLKEYGTAR